LIDIILSLKVTLHEDPKEIEQSIGLDESQKLDPRALDESQEQKKKWQIKAKP
jgi:hypothetical protein